MKKKLLLCCASLFATCLSSERADATVFECERYGCPPIALSSGPSFPGSVIIGQPIEFSITVPLNWIVNVGDIWHETFSLRVDRDSYYWSYHSWQSIVSWQEWSHTAFPKEHNLPKEAKIDFVFQAHENDCIFSGTCGPLVLRLYNEGTETYWGAATDWMTWDEIELDFARVNALPANTLTPVPAPPAVLLLSSVIGAALLRQAFARRM